MREWKFTLIELLIANGQQGGIVELFYGEWKTAAGSVRIDNTGGKYITVKMKLDKPLSGRQRIGFRFSNPDCCTFSQ